MEKLIEQFEEQIKETQEMQKYYEYDSDEYSHLTEIIRRYYSSLEDVLDAYSASKWVRTGFNKIQDANINDYEPQLASNDCCSDECPTPEECDKEDTEEANEFQDTLDKMWKEFLIVDDIEEENDGEKLVKVLLDVFLNESKNK